jgi:Ca2+-binding RTX toxin-like protein
MADYRVTAGTDRLIGDDEDDVFNVVGSYMRTLSAADVLSGGGGSDVLTFSGITSGLQLGSDRLVGLSSVEEIDVTGVSGGLNIVLDAATIRQADGDRLTVTFGTSPLALGIVSKDPGDAVVLSGSGQVTLRNFDDQTVRIADGLNGRVAGGDRNDTILGGNGNDTLAGAKGADVLNGGAGNDVLDGGAGVDVIITGSGRDVVTGGTEADLFQVGSGSTTITDFAVDFHLERIDLRGVAAATDFSKLTVADTAGGAQITVADTTILLKGIAASAVSAGNFIFSGTSDPNVILVDAGTSEAIIQRIVDEAPPGSTIKLAAGTYTFDQTLTINRSDITFEGAGSGKTVIRSAITDANASSVLEVRGGLSLDKAADLATTAVKGSNTLQLTSTAGLKVGDVVRIAQNNDDAFFAATGNTGVEAELGPDVYTDRKALRESLSKIVAIDGNTVTVAEPLPYTFEAGKGWVGQFEALQNVTVGGFRIETGFTSADPNAFVNTKPAWEGTATVVFKSMTGGKVYDIEAYNNASKAFVFNRVYGLTADHLVAVGAHNKGGDGNGYGFSLEEAFANTFTHLTDKDMRHGVLFSSWSAEHHNHIQIDSTNRDINFHGSPDSDNTIIVERAEASYGGGGSSWPIVGPGSFPVHPLSTIADNDIRFHYLRSTDHGETIRATDDNADIDAAGGDDVIAGGKGADRLSGGEGNDTIRDTGTGSDTINGGTGDDTIEAGRGSDVITGGEGNDTIRDGGGNDRINGGADRDVIRGGAGDDTLSGDDGADILDGEAGTDTLTGGTGSDILKLGAGDTGTGGTDSDTFVVTGNATITDFAVADPLEKIDLRGIAGATSFSALKRTQIGTDAQVVVGGVTILLKNVEAAALNADDFVFVGTTKATYAELQTRMSDASLTDTIKSVVGTAGDDLFGGSGVSFVKEGTVFGGAGTDTLRLASDKFTLDDAALSRLSSVEIIDVSQSLGGAVFLVGARGVGQADGDVLTLYGGNRALSLDTSAVGGAGKVVVETFGTVSLARDVNNVVTVSSLVDGTVIGNTGRDAITGGARSDTLTGGVGDDVLDGGAGNDIVDGGLGDDVLKGGSGRDRITGGEGDDTFLIEGGATVTGGIGSDTFVIYGSTTITDFAAADRMEKIDLRPIKSATSFAALKLLQSGADTRVQVAGREIVLKNVAPSQLTADNFIFYGSTEQTLASQHSRAPVGLLSSGADKLTGTAGNDLFEGQTSQFITADTIVGGAGTDTLNLASNGFGLTDALLSRLSSVEIIDVSQSLGGAVFLVGARGVGQADGDVLTLRGGNRALSLDTSAVGGAGKVVVETFGTVSLARDVNNAVTVSSLVDGTVIGNTGRDAITGGARSDALTGGAGDDVLDGAGGNDILDAGLGDDVLKGGTGRDTLLAGAGNDTLWLEGGDTASGGTGSDTFVIYGGATITDFAVADRMEKIDLRPIKSATSFAALKLLQSGADTRVQVAGREIVLKNVAPSQLTADNFIFYGSTEQTLASQHSRAPVGLLSSGADKLTGTAGNDLFEGQTSQFITADTIVGGAGTDTLNLASNGFGLTDALLSRLSSVEIIDVSQSLGGAVFLVGARGVGQADGDVLTLRGGNRALSLDTSAVGGAGKVVVETFGTVSLARDVNNVVTVSNLVDGTVIGNTGRDAITGGARGDALTGGAGDDVLDGAGGNDILDAGLGDDVLKGGTGRDTLLAGAGNDTLWLEGGDTASGGTGSDTFVIYGGATITDFAVADRMEKIDLRPIKSATSFAALKLLQSGADTRVQVAGREIVLKNVAPSQLTADNFIFYGSTEQALASQHSRAPVGLLSSRADKLTGTAGNDLFEGQTSQFTTADTILGGAGTDTLSFVAGSVSLTESTLARLTSVEIIDVSQSSASIASFQIGAKAVGQADGDVLTLLGGTKNFVLDTSAVGSAGKVVVETFGTVALRRDAGNAVTVSDKVDGKVVGGDLRDTIFGGARADTLSGGKGADLLSGGLGHDVLAGGAGADTFVFATRPGSTKIDHITDFVAEDTIQLAKSVFATLATGQLAGSAFKDLGVTGAKLDADDRIVYNHDTGVLAYDADGSGKVAAVTIAVLDNKPLLTHADILVA